MVYHRHFQDHHWGCWHSEGQMSAREDLLYDSVAYTATEALQNLEHLSCFAACTISTQYWYKRVTSVWSHPVAGLVKIIQPLVVPPHLANGKQSKKWMKEVIVSVFQKVIWQIFRLVNQVQRWARCSSSILKANHSVQKSSSVKDSSISGSQACQDRNTEDKLKEQWMMAYQALEEQWTCEIHTMSSQKAQCWPDPVKTGYCHPLTKVNLGYWAMLYVSLSVVVLIQYLILISFWRCQIPNTIWLTSNQWKSMYWQIQLLVIDRKPLRPLLGQLRNISRWVGQTDSLHFHMASILHCLL